MKTSLLDDMYDLAVLIYPSHKTHWVRGTRYQRKKWYKQAIEDFEWIVKRNPDDFAAYEKLGECALAIGDHAKGALAYGEAFRIDPSKDELAYLAGVSYTHLDNHAEAINFFCHTIELKPQNSSAYYCLANSLYGISRFEEAMESINTAIELDGRQAKFLELRGDFHMINKDFSASMRDYRHALSLAPSARAHNRLGVLFSKMKMYQESLQELNQAIAMDPTDVDFIENRAKVHGHLRNYGATIADLEQAIPLSQKAITYNSVAWLLATLPMPELRDGPKAVRNALQACKLTEHKDPDFLDTLAAAYATSGNFAKAITTQEKAIDLVEENRKADFRSRLSLYQANIIYVIWPHDN